MRLNGWQRIGIVISVCWGIGAWIHRTDIDQQRYLAQFDSHYKLCMELRKLVPDSRGEYNFDRDCYKESEEYASAWSSHTLTNAALEAFVPIPFGWLFVYALIGIVRWIRRGFNSG